MMSRFFLSGCLILTIAIVGCTETTTPPTVKSSSLPSSSVSPKTVEPSAKSTPTASTQSSTPVSENLKISASGIGPAKLGMTLGQLKKVLGSTAEFKVQSPFIVDFDAIAVSQAGKVQYYILYPAGQPLADSGKIEYLLTENPNYRTDKGVGPGTPLKQAAAVYGSATLSYNTALEGREYVSFANRPAKNISFRLGAAGDASLAGVYPSAAGEFNQTKKYKDTASIRSVGVDCQGQSCAK